MKENEKSILYCVTPADDPNVPERDVEKTKNGNALCAKCLAWIKVGQEM